MGSPGLSLCSSSCCLLAAAHSPCPWPSHVRARMSPLSPYRLSLLHFYFFGFLPTLPVALIPLYFSVWLAGETERQGKEESCSRGGGRQLFLCPQYLPCSPLLHSTLRPPTVPSGPGPNPSRLTCLPIYRDHLLVLICSLCGPGQKLPCNLGDLFSYSMSSSSYP